MSISALLLLTAACADDRAQPEPTVAFWQDVAPIYFENCVTCHEDGGIAPFALDNYDDAKTWAQSAKLATHSRAMPPWLVTADGSCGEFHGSRRLTDEDLAVIARWVDGGAPEGTPRTDLTAPATPGLTDAATYTTPDFIPEIASGEFAAFDEYRCFAIDPGRETDTFITGYDVIPGNPALVHHALVMLVIPDQVVNPDTGATNRDVIELLDGQSPDRDGWPCYGMAGEGVDVASLPVTWAPGMGVVDYPAESGVFLERNDLLVVQMHYNLVDEDVRGQSDATAIKLRLRDEVRREGFFDLSDGFVDTVFTGEPATLEPGRESVTFTFDVDYDDEMAALGVPYIDIHGVFPHMHELGDKWRMEVIRGGGGAAECGADVTRWDFGWQLFYFYQRPLRLQPGDSLRVTCEYDTRGVSAPVAPGWGTQNEMCLAGLYLAAP